MNAAQHGKTASSAWGWEAGACRQTGHAAKGGTANSGVTSPRGGEKGGEGQLCGASVRHSTGIGSVAGAGSTGASGMRAPSGERGEGLSGTVKGEAVKGGGEGERRDMTEARSGTALFCSGHGAGTAPVQE